MKLLYQQLENKQKFLLTLMFICTFVFVAANSFIVVILSTFIDLLTKLSSNSSTIYEQPLTIWEQLLSPILNNANFSTNQILGILLGVVAILVTFSFILRIFVRIQLARMSMQMIFNLRNNLYKHILYLKEDAFDNISPSSIINRINNDMYLLQESAINYYMYFYEYLFYIALNIIFSITLSPLLSTIYLLIIPINILICYFTEKKADKYYEENLISLDTTNQIIRENILGSRIIKAFNLQKHQYQRFIGNNRKWLNTIVKAEIMMMLTIILLYILLNLSIIVILIFGGLIEVNNIFGGISIGVIVAFVNYIYSNVFSIYGLTNTLLGLFRIKPVVRRIKEIKDKTIENLNTGIIPNNFIPKIEFKNVNFSYEKNNQILNLKNINLVIEPNQTIGIIGQTGSGKSTLVNLIANLYDPLNGEIKINDININDLNLNFLRNQIGYAFQNKLIFAGTIKSNILNGNNQATDSEIAFATLNACADEFINKLPLKYENPVNQYGTNLSGGQKQRLSLARALVRNPKILILDDTLSALDNLTRDQVLSNINLNYKNTTKIIVSQQIKTIKNANKIVLMDSGEIVNIGTHDELIKNSSLYKEIFESQQTIGDA
ncbi:ABC transporter ATP-binding protein [Mycoplasmoides pirum]|uniref:ABC transporter ATP-binding protein n=1 Tax=Mycoplasmoides pirum TaxID=2122 RepID=UPI000697D3A6|nr:ABC transporter ATP-binding protein [Mycoplasmoides pirum]